MEDLSVEEDMKRLVKRMIILVIPMAIQLVHVRLLADYPLGLISARRGG